MTSAPTPKPIHRVETRAGVVRAPTSGYPDDGALVLRALDGDRWAEEALFARHAPEITAIVTRLLRQSDEADDVVQDTFIAALTELDRLRDPSAFKYWLIRIAIRKVHRRFRRRSLLRMLGLDRSTDDVTLESLASPTVSPEVRAELAWLDRALEALAPADRIAWILRHVEGASLSQVAMACDCSLATAKRRITRAQQRIGVTFAEKVDHD